MTERGCLQHIKFEPACMVCEYGRMETELATERKRRAGLEIQLRDAKLDIEALGQGLTLEREQREAAEERLSTFEATTRHYPIERTPDVETCYTCGQPWPCDWRILLGEKEAAERERNDAREQLYERRGERDAARCQLEVVREALERVPEWCIEEDGTISCHVCYQRQDQGHADDCVRAALSGEGDCSFCKGHGHVGGTLCAACRGSGRGEAFCPHKAEAERLRNGVRGLLTSAKERQEVWDWKVMRLETLLTEEAK